MGALEIKPCSRRDNLSPLGTHCAKMHFCLSYFRSCRGNTRTSMKMKRAKLSVISHKRGYLINSACEKHCLEFRLIRSDDFWSIYSSKTQGRTNGAKEAQHPGGQKVTLPHVLFQYTTFAPERPQARTWGRTCFLSRAPSN